MEKGTRLVLKSQEDTLISSLLYADYPYSILGLNIRLGLKSSAQITREWP